MKTVLVFGVFDGLHDGHRDFLRQAKRCGDRLIVIVARDAVVEKLKNRQPWQNEKERMRALEAERLGDEATLGDAEIGEWNVLRKYRPDVIAVGYDQTAIRESLEKQKGEFDWDLEIVMMGPHKPEEFHSSLLAA